MARFVRQLRLWLPLSALVVLLLLFIWPHILPNFEMMDVAKNIPDLVVDNLHYTGVDGKNLPYSLMAAQATKPSNLKGIYDLIKPEGDITLSDGSWLDCRAAYGRYDEAGKKLWLGGNVQIFRNDGLQVTSDDVQINLNTHDIWSDKNVEIQWDEGNIQGKGFRFLNSGETIVIQGPARAILSLQARENSDKPSLP